MSVPSSSDIPTPKSTNKGQIDSLQSIRGLAALIIFFRHYFTAFPVEWKIPSIILDIFMNFDAAIVLFFVLSGFVLAPSFLEVPLDLPEVVGFYVRRAFRILPLLMTITGLSLLYVHMPIATVRVPFATNWFDNILTAGMPLSPAGLIECFSGMKSALVPQNWTLMVELLVAIILPFLIKLCSRGPVVNMLTLAVLTLISFGFSGYGGKSLPLIYAVDFAIGINAARIYLTPGIRLSETWFYLGLAGLLCSNTIICFLTGRTPVLFHDPLCSLVEAFSAGVVIFGLTKHNRMAGWLCWKPLVWLGNISYGIYLVHFLVLAVTARCLGAFIAPLSPAVRSLSLFAIVFSLILLCAHILHSTIELPFNRLGRMLQKSILKSGKNHSR